MKTKMFTLLSILFVMGGLAQAESNAINSAELLKTPMALCIPEPQVDFVFREAISKPAYPFFCFSVFEAVDCLVKDVQISGDEITCSIEGRWTMAPPGFEKYTENGFGIHRWSAKSEWKALCDQFLRWKGKRALLSIRCSEWSSRGGFIIFSNGVDRVQLGTEKPELIFNPGFNNVLQRSEPTLAVSGRYGWVTQ